MSKGRQVRPFFMTVTLGARAARPQLMNSTWIQCCYSIVSF